MKHPYEDRFLNYLEIQVFLNFIKPFFWKNFEKVFTDSSTPDLEYDWIIISKVDFDNNKTFSIRELKRHEESVKSTEYSSYLQKSLNDNPECLIIITRTSGVRRGDRIDLNKFYNFITNRKIQEDLVSLFGKNLN